MTIEFNREDRICRFLNPFNNFEQSEAKCQVRWDPLTHRTGRLAHFAGVRPPEADLSKIIEGSATNCPFCPENLPAMTPKFVAGQIPEGRIEKGESTIFPNLLPYDANSALAVLCKKHYRALTEFTPQIFTDAFVNCLDYLDRVISDKKATFGLVTWNYMPPAASSQVHPHFQVYATETPGNFIPTQMVASQAYYRKNKRIYWEDYVESEIQAGERLIKETASGIWLTDFVSLSALTDIIGIFPHKQTLFDLSRKEIEDAGRMINSLIYYLGQQGVYSLNMSWMPALQGRKDYWLQLRISPRLYMAPQVWCTDTPSFFYQYQESFMLWLPEDTAGDIRTFIS